MRIHFATLETCSRAAGVVVAIDVIRAYTAAAFALAAGARQILLVGAVDEAFALKNRFPGALLMGEVGGLPPAGFDLGNSPSALAGLDLTGRTLIHRTSAGTQGPVRARRASALFGASFVVAAATARSILALRPAEVTLVVTGDRPDDPGDEDWACAEYLDALLRGESPYPAPFLARARRSLAAEKFLDPAQADFPLADLDCCLQLDRFNFAMPVEREEKLLILKRDA